MEAMVSISLFSPNERASWDGTCSLRRGPAHNYNVIYNDYELRGLCT